MPTVNQNLLQALTPHSWTILATGNSGKWAWKGGKSLTDDLEDLRREELIIQAQKRLPDGLFAIVARRTKKAPVW
jgi:hypothetical protein